jgi:hypothetical protein
MKALRAGMLNKFLPTLNISNPVTGFLDSQYLITKGARAKLLTM